MTLSQLTEAHEAVTSVSGGPRGAAAWLTAYALIPAASAGPADTASLQAVHQDLRNALGSMRAPTGDLRWIYAALLASHGKSPDAFLKLRDALRTDEKASGTGKLYGGGARAALVLTLAGADSASAVRRFYAIKQAIRPPWWRANPAITDLFAASLAAREDSAETVRREREAAFAIFESNRHTRGLKREGARLCALYQQPASEVLDRYLALREAVRSHKTIRYSGHRHIYIEWAAQGVTPDDLLTIEANMAELGKVPQTGSVRLRLAQLVWLSERGDGSLGAVSAMTAVIAAQTAAIIAVTTASSAAVTASSAGR